MVPNHPIMFSLGCLFEKLKTNKGPLDWFPIDTLLMTKRKLEIFKYLNLEQVHVRWVCNTFLNFLHSFMKHKFGDREGNWENNHLGWNDARNSIGSFFLSLLTLQYMNLFLEYSTFHFIFLYKCIISINFIKLVIKKGNILKILGLIWMNEKVFSSFAIWMSECLGIKD